MKAGRAPLPPPPWVVSNVYDRMVIIRPEDPQDTDAIAGVFVRFHTGGPEREARETERARKIAHLIVDAVNARGKGSTP